MSSDRASKRVYIGLGSNINANENIVLALSQLSEHFSPITQSPLYKNPPVGFQGDDFLNMVIAFDYSGSISHLMSELEDIELKAGRVRSEEKGKGSRTLDLDLLIFGEQQEPYATEKGSKQLPRPEIFDRQFIWQPLLDLLSQQNEFSSLEKRVKKDIEALATQFDKWSPVALSTI